MEKQTIGSFIAALRKANGMTQKQLAEKLCLTIPSQAPGYRQLRPKWEEGFVDNRYGMEPEEHLITTLHLISKSSFMHLPSGKCAELYIPHQSSFNELKSRVPEDDSLLFGFDYRGIGESTPAGCDQGAWAEDFFGLYRRDYHYDAMARLLGFSVLGKRTEDVMKAILLLKEAGIEEITLTASGIGMFPAILAALYSPVKVKTAFITRCRSVLESSLSGTDNLPQSMTLFNILSITDFDQLQRFVEE
jgi:transcriptional regulator with XRE-family HTH domain